MTSEEKAELEALRSQVEDLSQRLYDLEVQPGLASIIRWTRSRLEDLHDRYGSWRKESFQQWKIKIVDWGLKILK